ncbi:cation:proton antiporter [Halomarina pelagica]|uniref:cation:proton antiporter n=1 Tax=Halomarina pelagica TaxID=2961599 RepID=UPI0020C491DE|nr:cation:proton antiporter [Halomarina sp. BND7]
MQEYIEPLARQTVLLLLVQLALILFVARALGALAERVGYPVVVGELLTGIVLGPSVLGLLAPDLFRTLFPPNATQFHLLEVVAFIGLLLLLVLTGLETDLELIRRESRTAAAISLAGIAVPFAMGFALGEWMPREFLATPDQPIVFSLFLATALSISAIPVVARVLMDLDALGRGVGQLTIVAAMVDDTIGWFLLSLVAGLARRGGFDAVGTVTTAGFLFAFLIVAFTVGQWLVTALMNSAATGSDRTTLSTIVILALGTGAITVGIGLEAVLGAYVVGILVERSGALDGRTFQAFENITIGVFAPVFFATAGLRVDLSALAEPSTAAIAAITLAVAIAGKFVGAAIGALGTGRSRWVAFTVGAGLNARGAIELVVATVGLQLGVLTIELYSIIVLVAVVTSLMAPPLLRWSLARHPEEHAPERADEVATHRH